MDNVNDMLGKITEFLKSEAKTENIIGQQFKLGEFTCVPVISIGIGFGGGSGDAKNDGKKANNDAGSGAGGAGGIGMSPSGFLVTKGDQIQFIPANTKAGLSSAFEKIPDLIEKFMSSKKESQKN